MQKWPSSTTRNEQEGQPAVNDSVKTDTPIHLCLVVERADEAATLITALEKHFDALEVNQIRSKAALNKASESGQCDVVVGVPSMKRFDAYQATTTLRKLNKTTPVIGISTHKTESDIVEAMNRGLADLIDQDNTEHLALVVKRELSGRSLPASTSEPRVQHDFTGLYSRLYFLDLLRETLRDLDANANTMALLYVQLDSFAWINENIGISAGDLYLKAIASVIMSNLEDHDLPARYHGGTFVILMHGQRVTDLREKADTLAQAIADHVFEFETHAVSSTSSIGLSLLSDMTEDPQLLITHSFMACENAKASGGNCVQWYGAQATSKEIVGEGDPEAWVTRIHQAFENDMFTLLFQPIISLQGHKTPRYEVLLRMLSDEGDTILPGAFLPFAERAGLMADIDRWVITNALTAAQDLRGAGIEPEVFLKLSGQTLADKSMSSWISHAFKESECPGSCIVFEITESLAIGHLAQTRMLTSGLRQLGCKIGLDHFGTNPNSLKALDHVHADYVKIDGSLIRGLQKNEGHQQLVRKIIEKAKGKGVGTIAESVQDAGSLPIIWQYGVEFIQGYFLQEPGPEMGYDFSQLVF
jgi:diguanylate cyclase (GGDEF)-like protein